MVALLLKELDKDKSGAVEIHELVHFLQNGPKSARALQTGAEFCSSTTPAVEQLREHVHSKWLMVSKLFAEWDTNGDGLVGKSEFRAAVSTLGLDTELTNANVVDALFDAIDADGTGHIEYRELRAALRPQASVEVISVIGLRVQRVMIHAATHRWRRRAVLRGQSHRRLLQAT